MCCGNDWTEEAFDFLLEGYDELGDVNWTVNLREMRRLLNRAPTCFTHRWARDMFQAAMSTLVGHAGVSASEHPKGKLPYTAEEACVFNLKGFISEEVEDAWGEAGADNSFDADLVRFRLCLDKTFQAWECQGAEDAYTVVHVLRIAALLLIRAGDLLYVGDVE